MNLSDIEIKNNEDIHNFEIFVDGQRAFIDYKAKDNKLYLIHTEVAAELQGKCVAEALVEKTFTYMEAHQLKLVPLCTYIQAYLKRHPEWNRLLA
ncbi:GNAT family N-acetyltransferase [Mucilaginibacter glaciei]|uniref:N-acetyltransferase n=1 Tax=Mucilaginibacter glaciei TaxID=2772109 RepID=A0A926NI64_9SPHI|nr:GNAT family N-acetyltransferase [Mucilaginibacter glaciei]MBD1391701.1 N-acetyltransferase [Mucilaginibacter glaciei]